MLDLDYIFTPNYKEHYYTFACTGMKIQEKEFTTRDSANKFMYKLCDKYGLHIKEVWKDNHDVTFVCDNNVKFYIQRV